MRTSLPALSLLAVAGIALACPMHFDDYAHDHGPASEMQVLGAAGQPGAPIDWRAGEEGVLTDHVMLTDPERFSRAGEAYFNHDLTWIIFQATERATEGEEQSPHYEMYVARLIKDDAGTITGTEEPIQVSPTGSANTCGFFDPVTPGRIILGSTRVPPSGDETAGYQRGESRYAWSFPIEMEVCQTVVKEVFLDEARADMEAALGMNIGPDTISINTNGMSPSDTLRPLFERPGGYDAECAFSPDGRHIVFSAIDPETGDADLRVFDHVTRTDVPVVTIDGYDGGPFFSPCGTRICYRSDRVGNDLLQIYVADLEFDDNGTVVGVSAEYQLTNNEHVNWAPYWHPSGEHLVYASSEFAHWNYEVFSVPVPPKGSVGAVGGNTLPREANAPGGVFAEATRRVTIAAGFDGLPVFSDDGTYMMWTSQRGPKVEGEERPSSQVWVARPINTAP